MPKNASIRKNDVVTLKIEDITDLGFGVAKHEGIVVFVSDTVPGDEAVVKIIKVNASFAVGRCEKLLTSSPLRVSDRCSAKSCRACAYKCVSYADELMRKEDGVRRLFSSQGIETLPILASLKEKRYRNKAQYPIAKVNGEYVFGFFAPKSHRVTPVTDCLLLPTEFSEICERLKPFFKEQDLSVYDEETGTGLLRHLYLRRAEATGEILVTLVINGSEIPHEAELVNILTESFSEIVGILINENRESTNVILGEKYKVIFGRDHIFDTLCDVRLKITAPSFYQVNHDTAELLYNEARKLAAPTKSDTLLDLYCGAGSIGLSMAKDVGELVGIEIVKSAVLCAEENAKASGIDNAHFFTGDAKNTERLLETAEKQLNKPIRPDIVILDPPRAGCDAELIKFVSQLSPKRIVYISCNPKTLARDVALFKEHGYTTPFVQPVDMFPGTGHVESLVCLTKQTN